MVDFPENWTVTNTPSQVLGKAPGGKRGAQISVARHEPVKRKSPEEYVVDVLKRDDVVDGFAHQPNFPDDMKRDTFQCRGTERETPANGINR